MNDTQKTFNDLFEQWAEHLETDPSFGIRSDLEAFIDNEAYRAIVSLGKPALPFLVEKLREGYFQFNTAVSDISGITPKQVTPEGIDFYSEQELAGYYVAWWDAR